MPKTHLSRRDLLLKCAAGGSLTVAGHLSLAQTLPAWEKAVGPERGTRKATQWAELGPFYKRKAPRDPHLRKPNDAGLPLTVSGKVFDTRGSVLPGATLEIWQADNFGRYDLDGYRFRATLAAGESGEYGFESVMPGHYPGRVCQHIHYTVTAPGHKALTTQLYFATDPAFDGDPARNYSRDPLILSSELVRPVVLTGDPKNVIAAVTFEIVLEPA